MLAWANSWLWAQGSFLAGPRGPCGVATDWTPGVGCRQKQATPESPSLSKAMTHGLCYCCHHRRRSPSCRLIVKCVVCGWSGVNVLALSRALVETRNGESPFYLLSWLALFIGVTTPCLLVFLSSNLPSPGLVPCSFGYFWNGFCLDTLSQLPALSAIEDPLPSPPQPGILCKGFLRNSLWCVVTYCEVLSAVTSPWDSSILQG